jgi:hypothetical protein
MSTQNEAHGDEDYKEQDSDHLADALQDVIECILECGQYPANGRVEFDLYDFLFEHRDPSYALEMYVASMSSDIWSFEQRVQRERKTVESLLVQELTGSEMVQELADVMAEDDE